MKTYLEKDVLESTLKYFNGDSLATDVWMNKYCLRDLNSNYYELNPDQMHHRLAKAFAEKEKNYPNSLSYDEIYESFKGFKNLVPQGSPMSAIGNPFQVQSISNCFVIDSPEDSYGGILYTDQQQAQIMKRRGGVGFDVSNLRPKGLVCRNAARTTSGIESWLARFSNTTREVGQDGRRGALMITIDIRHPQIRDFINIKSDLSKVTGANISIRVNDDFMESVVAEKEFKLQWPVDSEDPEVVEMVQAKEIWDMIVENNWLSAEPGILYWDTVKRNTPSEVYGIYRAAAVNPCVTGDTIVETDKGQFSVKELSDSGDNFYVKSYNTKTEVTEMKPAIAFKTKENAELLKITTKSGKVIKLTPDHKVFTDKGWVMAGELTEDHKILGVSN